MRPTETLKHEHQIVLQVLKGAEREARQIEVSATVRAGEIQKIIDFSRNFTDRCHHAKEEKHLFCRLGERGLPCDAGPIAVMLQEHEQGRQIIRDLATHLTAAADGDRAAIFAAKDLLYRYVDLLRAHIEKEDTILFPLADDLLESKDQTELAAAFDRVETEEMGAGVHEKYHQLAHELAGKS